MGICWGIVVEDRERLDRWVAVVAAKLTSRIVVPLTDLTGVVITQGAEPVIECIDVTEILAEMKLLRFDEVLRVDVERRFDGYSVFLPDSHGPRRLPTVGFETNAEASGVGRLLDLQGFDAFDLQLRAAARMAIRNSLAIEFSY